MAGFDVGAQDSTDRREQPFLYSWNRRIRHLHGISLRNLNIAPTASRSRGKTITDDEYNLTTPAKRLVSDERVSLHASKSFSNLPKTQSPSTVPQLNKASTFESREGSGAKVSRPGKLRRRSTLHWSGASPQVRQQKLVDVAIDRIVDTWFSIHHAESEVPVYISEVMQKSMNPSFSYFDLDCAKPPVSRSDTFELKIWTKNERMQGYRLLLDMTVNLRSLQFLAKSLEHFRHPLPENCVLFHLSDGIYTSFADLAADEVQEPQLRGNQKSMPHASSSTYDALMKLANLDDCIQDALQTREKLEADINTMIAENKQSVTDAHVEARKQRLKATRSALHKERLETNRLIKTKMGLEKSRDERKRSMEEAVKIKNDAAGVPDEYKKKLQDVHSKLDNLEEVSRGQIRRICEDIQIIYPIEPLKHRALQFTIRNIYLPNSVFDDTNRDEIAAALGFTAQLVYQISMYLSIPLPYEIDANASSSSVSDSISMALAQRKFPLYPTNVNYKFEYGVFLLNKDIEFLMNRVDLRVLDIRHTLPNLKYLLFVLTAGTGEIPSRKVGGIRGLSAGIASPYMSRRNSSESGHSKSGSIDHTNGSIVAGALAREREKSPEGHDPFMGVGRVKGLPYRKSLLREAG